MQSEARIPKSERYPKPEIRRPMEIRIPNSERNPFGGGGFGFRISGLIRISAFGFRLFHLGRPAGQAEQPHE